MKAKLVTYRDGIQGDYYARLQVDQGYGSFNDSCALGHGDTAEEALLDAQNTLRATLKVCIVCGAPYCLEDDVR